MAECRHEQLYLIGIREQPIRPGLRRIRFQTSRGQFEAVAHTGAEADRGVVMLSGFRGDFEGPGLVYPELASRLADEGLMALRLSYRIPGDCVQCGLDTLLALQYLYDEGIEDVVVVGWSFGAAVAVAVGVGRENRARSRRRFLCAYPRLLYQLSAHEADPCGARSQRPNQPRASRPEGSTQKRDPTED
jgi:hypothetical protein